MQKHPEHEPPDGPIAEVERQISAAFDRYTDSQMQIGKRLLLLKARDPAGFDGRLHGLGMSPGQAEELMAATAVAYGLTRNPSKPLI